MISLLISFLSLWQNTWDYQFKKRKCLLCSSCGAVWACVGKAHHGGKPGWRRLLTFWWKEAKREQEGLEFQDLPQGHASVMGIPCSGPHWFKVPPPPITPLTGDQSFNAWTFEDIFKPQWTWAEMNLYIMLKGGNFQTCPQRQNPQREDLKKLLNIQIFILFKHPCRQSQNKLWIETKGISINPLSRKHWPISLVCSTTVYTCIFPSLRSFPKQTENLKP